MKRLACTIIAGTIVAGCVAGPDYRRPTVDVPNEPPASVEQAAEWAQWWQRFDDPVLDGLVEEALRDNLEVRIALARVREARASLGLAQAERLPTVSAQADASRERSNAAMLPGGNNGRVTQNTFSIVGQLGYEIDLWGRLAREQEAATAAVAESEYAVDALRLTLVADVANSYFALRAAEEQRLITRRTIEVRQEAVRIERDRYQVGEADELVLRQAESLLASARAQLPSLDRQVESTRNTLAILIGRTPAELMQEPEFEGPSLTEIDLPRIVPDELPLNLLERRPDLRAAESGLVAANASIGTAKAARLPNLSLSALLGKTSSEASDLFDVPNTWSAGASLFGPILNFGRSRSRIEQAEALRERAELQWRQASLAAYGEVRDAIISFQTNNRRVTALNKQIVALERTAELAGIRYDEGLVRYIEKLDADRTLLEARLQLSTAQSELLTAAATLFKAIGGGWTDAALAQSEN